MDVSGEIVVERPHREVAAFVFDTGNDSVWHAGSAHSAPPGRRPELRRLPRGAPLSLPRRRWERYRIVGLEEGRWRESGSTLPFLVVIRYELEDEGARTRVRLRVAGDATGFLRLGEPLIASATSRGIVRNLKMLKAHLEGTIGAGFRASSELEIDVRQVARSARRELVDAAALRGVRVGDAPRTSRRTTNPRQSRCALRVRRRVVRRGVRALVRGGAEVRRLFQAHALTNRSEMLDATLVAVYDLLEGASWLKSESRGVPRGAARRRVRGGALDVRGLRRGAGCKRRRRASAPGASTPSTKPHGVSSSTASAPP